MIMIYRRYIDGGRTFRCISVPDDIFSEFDHEREVMDLIWSYFPEDVRNVDIDQCIFEGDPDYIQIEKLNGEIIFDFRREE